MKSKNILSTAALALLAGLTITSAHADGMTIGGVPIAPYLGADYQYSNLDYTSGDGPYFMDSLSGFDTHGGLRIGKYAGIEIGYMDTGSGSKNTTNYFATPFATFTIPTTSKIDISGPVFDLMGYLPLGADESWELIGTVGISDLTANVSGSIGTLTGSANYNEVGFRAGGGAQYFLTDNLNVRALVRYQSADFSGLLNDAVLVNVGFNYEF